MSLEKFRSAIQELGLLNFVLYRLHLLLVRLFRGRVKLFKYYFASQPVSATPMVKNAHRRKIKILQIDSDSPLIAHFPRPADVIKARFEQNSLCFVATKGDAFIGYIWFNMGAYIEDEVRCVFEPQPEGRAAWDYDVYIDPEHRMGMAFAMLWDRVNERLHENGYIWCTSRISAFNPDSLSSHKKLGAKITGSAFFLCIGGFQLMLSSLSPHINFSLRNTPHLRVPAPDLRADGASTITR